MLHRSLCRFRQVHSRTLCTWHFTASLGNLWNNKITSERLIRKNLNMKPKNQASFLRKQNLAKMTNCIKRQRSTQTVFHKNDTTTSTYVTRFQILFAQILRRTYPIKWSFYFPPHLTNVSALPGETWTQEIASFHKNTAYRFTTKHNTFKLSLGYHITTLHY